MRGLMQWGIRNWESCFVAEGFGLSCRVSHGKFRIHKKAEEQSA